MSIVEGMQVEDIEGVEEGVEEDEAPSGDAVLEQENLAQALAARSVEDLAAGENEGYYDPLKDERKQAREYVTRQFVAVHCPTWTNFVVEALLECINLDRPVRIGALPGDGATKARDRAYAYCAKSEAPGVLLLRQAIADPLDAGISPEGPGGGALVQRVRMSISFAEGEPVAILVSTARPDSALSGRETAVTQLFVPRVSAWGEDPARLSAFTRETFAERLANRRADVDALDRAAPGWALTRLLLEDLDRIAATTGGRRVPTPADKEAIALAPRALRNLVGSSHALAFGLAELAYLYRRYEVLP